MIRLPMITIDGVQTTFTPGETVLAVTKRLELAAGEVRSEALLGLVRREIAKAPRARIDYVELRDPESLAPAPELLRGPALLALAVFLDPAGAGEPVRLIDNRRLDPDRPL